MTSAAPDLVRRPRRSTRPCPSRDLVCWHPWQPGPCQSRPPLRPHRCSSISKLGESGVCSPPCETSPYAACAEPSGSPKSSWTFSRGGKPHKRPPAPAPSYGPSLERSTGIHGGRAGRKTRAALLYKGQAGVLPAPTVLGLRVPLEAESSPRVRPWAAGAMPCGALVLAHAR